MKTRIVNVLSSLFLIFCSMVTFGQMPYSPCNPSGGKKGDILGIETRYRAPGGASPVFNIPAGTRSITVYISSETGLTTIADNPQGDEDFITVNAIIDLTANTSSGYVNYARNTFVDGSGTNLYGWQKVPLGAYIPNASKIGDATPNLNNVNFTVSGSTLTITESENTIHSSYYVEYVSPYNNSINPLAPEVRALLHGTAAANRDLTIPIPAGANIISISGKGTNSSAVDLNTAAGTEEGYSNLRVTIDVDAGYTDGFVTLANGGSVDRRSTYVINNLASSSTMNFLSSAAITGDYTSKLTTAGAVGVYNPQIYVSGTNLVIRRDANYARDFDDAYVVEFYHRVGQGMSAEFINSDIQPIPKGVSSTTGISRTFNIPPGTNAIYFNETGNACNTDRESNENSIAAYAYIDLTTETATGYFYQQVGLDGVNRRDDNFAFKGVALNGTSVRNHASTVGFKGPNAYDIVFTLSADKTQLTVTNRTGLANPDYQFLLSMDYYGARPDVAFDASSVALTKGPSCNVIRATFNVCNPGAGNSSGGMPVSFYHGDPTTDPTAVLLYTGAFGSDLLEGECKVFTYDITMNGFDDLNVPMTIVINDNGSFVAGGVGTAVGTPFTLASLATQSSVYKECNYDNNLITRVLNVNNCPVPNLDADNSSGAVGRYNYLNYFNAGSAGGVKINDADLAVVDPGGTTIASATITLTNRLNGAAESIFINGTLPAGITATGSGTGTIVLSGVASQAAYVAALRMIEYQNSNPSPNTTNRIITTVLNDGLETGPASTTTIVILTDPRINVAGNGTTIADNSVTVNATDGTDFGNTISTSVAHTFSISNVGTGVINLIGTPAVSIASGDAGFTISTQPGVTALSAAQNTNFVVNFNPAAHAVGVYTAVIRIQNNDTNTDRADFTFTVSVTVNGLPTVTNFTVNGTEDNTLAFTAANFTSNYNDPDGAALNSIRITSLPLNGSFRLGGVLITVGQDIPAAQLGNITFVPTANWSGTTGFDWRAYDGTSFSAGTSRATINIQPVNDAPQITTPTSIAVTEDIPASLKDISFSDIDAGTGVVTVTFSVPNGTLNATSGLGVTVSGTPSALILNGTIADINAFLVANRVNYLSTQNPPPTVLLTVNISDNGNTGAGGAQTATATVPLGITAVNDVPTGTGDTRTTPEDTPVTGAVTGNDVDGDVLTYTLGTPPVNGTATVNSATGAYTYTPNPNFNGTDAFTVVINDGKGGTVTVTVNITVTAVNDAPTGANVTRSTPEDTPVSGVVVGNDVDGDALTYAIGTTTPASGTAVVNADGTFTYTPNANFNGTDVFTVVINDGKGGTATVTVTITVTPVNDAPTGANVTRTTPEDTPVSGAVVGNDVDGDALTYAIGTTSPASGTAIVNADGTFTYTPNANFNGTDVFTVVISDGKGGTVTVTVTITVTAVNDAPTGTNVTRTTPEDTPVSGAVIGNDADGDPLTYIIGTTTPANGSVVVNPDGTFNYTPNADFNGTDVFTVVISDGNGGTATVTVTITVTPVNDAPTGANQNLTTPEETPLTGAVVGADVDGDPLTYAIGATTPANGTVVVNADGTFVYTPNADFNGTDAFTVVISDGNGGTATVTINITVTAVNDAPTGANQNLSTPEETPLTGAVVGADADGDALTYAIGTTTPANGTVVVNADGTFTYTPNTDFNGTDAFTVVISDGNGGTATVTVNITVTPVNDAPTGTNQNLSTPEETPLTGAVVGNDVDGDPLTYAIGTTTPANGTVVVNADGTFVYTPNADFNGTDVFTVVISDGNGGTTTVTINITVTAVNDAPTGANQNLSTPEETPLTGAVVGNDVDGDPLTYAIGTTTPANGTVVVNADGTFVYTPNTDFNGTDAFTVVISDGNGGTATVTVTITVTPVNDAPTGANQNLSTPEETPLTGAVVGNDVDGDALTYAIGTTTPANGTVVVNADGTFVYTPNADFNGTDAFTVVISDGNGGTATVTINITVTAVNDAPTGANQNLSTPEETPLTGAVVGADVDGDPLTYAIGTTTPANGTVVVNADGTFVYTPNADFNGTDVFTVVISDGNGGTTTVTINITVTAVNDAPTGTNQNLSTPEETPLTGAVVGNDVDGDPLTYAIGTTTPANGTVVVNADGTFVYTPNTDFNGTDAFTVVISDGNGGTATVTVTITVTPVNDAPTGANQNLSTPEETPLTGAVVGADADGDALTYAIGTTTPANGTVVVNADGTFTYTPNTDFTGTDAFTVVISDGNGGTATVTVTITVTPVNDAPTGANQNLSTPEETPLTGAVVGNDVDGDPLTYAIGTTTPANGTVVVNADGTFVYTPNVDFNGTDAFTVVISDGNGGTATVTVTITVTPVNDAPTGANQNLSTPEETPLTGAVVGADADGDALTYAIGTTTPANGTVVVNADGTFVYTPNTDFNGTDGFTVVISDGNGGTATVTINITVTAVNDAPTGANQNLSTPEETPLTGAVVGNDVDGDPLTYAIGTTTPANGSVVVNADGTFVYTPNTDFTGTDAFTVVISDGNGGTATVTVNITVTPVNDAPTGANQNLTTPEETPLTGAVVGADADGDALTYAIGTTTPANGTVVVNVDGTFVYTPNADFNGTDVFTLVISDGNGGTATVTVTITVTPVNDAPTGTNQNLSTPEETPLTGAVVGNDVDGDPLTYAIGTTTPANGTVVVNADGTFVYTPNTDFNGTDAFTVVISDGNGGTTTVTINITVTAVNDAPTGANQNLSTPEETPLTGAVVGADADGDALTYAIGTTTPANGSVAVNADGTFVYTPNTDFTGTDAFTVVISDGNGGTATVTVTITVTPVNDAPTGANQNLSTPEETPLTGAVVGADVDGDALTYAIGTTTPANGTVVVNADGTFVYTPNADFTGTDAFTVVISDGNGGTATVTVTITVTPVNDAPTGTNLNLSTPEETPLNGTVVGADADGDALTYAIGTTTPANGSVVVNADGTFVYTPNTDFTGTDAFTVVISDGNGGTATVTINITVTAVNDAPTGANQNLSTPEETPLTGAVVGNDVDGDPLTYAIGTTTPANGSVIVNADGTFVYTPNTDFTGTDAFTVVISDGNGGTATVTVNITVTPVNDAPTGANQNLTTPEETPLTGAVVGADTDGDALTYAIGTTTPANGTVVVNADGTFTYTPNTDFTGTDAFTVVISDGNGGTATVTVNITVTPVNDAPTGTNQNLSTPEETPLTGAVVGNDVDGDALTYAIGTTTPANGTVVVNADGTFVYTPNTDFTGTDAFTVVISDGNGGTTTVTVTITVTPVNDAPMGTNLNLSTPEETPLTGAVVGADVDGDPLTYAIGTTTPANGSVVVNADGTFTYTPNTDFTGTDAFTVVISDGNGGTATVTVNITVTPVNDAPTGANQNLSTPEETPLTGAVVGADTDGDALTYAIGTTTPANGTVVVNADGTFVYTPNADFNGTDAFTVVISDGNGGTTTVTVNITVTAVNDAPTGANQNLSTPEETPLTGAVVGADVDGDPLTYAIGTTTPANGTVVVNADGTFVYTPNADFNGTDAFTVVISDGNGGTATVTVNITVTPVNDAPTGANQNLTTPEETPLTGAVVGNDVDGNPLTYAIGTTTPANGTVVVNADGTFVYTPNTDFTGTDAFTVVISDGNGGTTTVTVTITVTPVNDAPTGTNLNLSTPEETPLTGAVVGADVDGDPLTYSIGTTTPANGSVVVNADGTFTYTPNTDFTGTDAFTVVISDGNGGTATVTVNITVTPVNDAPTGANQNLTTPEETPLTGAVVGADADGDALTYAIGTTTPANGTVVVNADGTFVYTPNTDFTGTDVFTVVISDGNGGTATVTINITVTAVNDAPTGANQNLSTPEETPLTGAVVGADADGDALTYAIGTTTPANGTVVVNADGTFTYTPNTDFTGTDAFTVVISDGNGGTATVTINITVTAVNDAPTGVNQNLTTPEETPLTGAVVGNDVDGDALTYAIGTTTPANGTVVVNADGTFVYTPNTDFTGTDAFTVVISDGNGGTTTVTVTITVTPVNDAPTGTNLNLSTPEETPLTGAVVGADVDGDPLTYAIGTTTPANGSVVVNADGTFTYTPNTDFTGTDAFTVVISDGNGGTATVTVNITVTPVNDAPTGANLNLTTPEDTPLSGTVVGTDADGDALTYAIGTTIPANGTVVVNADGTFVYTPNADFTGTDAFTVVISDGNGGTATVTVNITVTPVNDIPTGANLNLTTPEDTPLNGAVVGADGDGDALTYAIGTTLPANGVVIVNADGTFVYTPSPDFNGTDAFTVVISDGNGGTATVTVTIVVAPVNDAPTGTGDTRTTPRNTPVNGAVSGTDVDGDVLTYTLGTPPANGTAVVNTDGTYTYTPNAGYSGPDSFTIIISDGNGGTVTVTVNITVTNINNAPTGTGDSQTTPEDTPVNGAVTGNDVDGDALTYVLGTAPANGGVIVNADGTYIYTPNANYNGPDNFTILISDGNGGSITVPVNIIVTPVNDAPTGTGDSQSTPQNTPVSGAVSGTDVDGDVLTYTLGTPPANGTAIVNADGSYTYTPNTGYTGPDSFTIIISDGNGGTVTVTVDINVITVVPNPAIALVKVGARDKNDITYIFHVTNTGNVPLHDIVVSDPQMGVTKNYSGTLQPGASVTMTAVYHITQQDKEAGSVTNTATVTGLTPANATVTDISGTSLNNDTPTETTVPAPPQAIDDEAETRSSTAVVIPVLNNDDPVESTFSIPGLTIISIPKHGQVTINEDGTIRYVPDNGYIGTDDFSYQISDVDGYITNIAVVKITIVETDLRIPPLFTPNGDGKNDVFEIRGLNKYVENELIMVNRWGNEVYRQKNYQNTWSGTGLNDGTYYYLLRAKKANGEWEVLKGYTTIIRKMKD